MGKQVKGRAAPAVSMGAAIVGDVGEVSADELVSLADEVGIEKRLREWADRENPERLQVLTYVYKYDNPTTGDLKVLCDRLEEEIPDPHAIGLQYGSGRYMVMVSIPNGTTQERKVKGLRFRLHARYDELRKAAAGGGGASPVPLAVAVAPQASLREGVEIVRSVVEMLAPLIAAQRSSSPDVSKILESSYDMTQAILRKSVENSQHLINQVQEARLAQNPADDRDEEPDFLGRVMPLLEQFLPVLLGGGAQAKTTAAMVRSLPQFSKVISNKDEMSRIVAWLDKMHGREKCDRLLSALRVNRPRVNGRSTAPAAAPVARVAVAGAARG